MTGVLSGMIDVFVVFVSNFSFLNIRIKTFNEDDGLLSIVEIH